MRFSSFAFRTSAFAVAVTSCLPITAAHADYPGADASSFTFLSISTSDSPNWVDDGTYYSHETGTYYTMGTQSPGLSAHYGGSRVPAGAMSGSARGEHKFHNDDFNISDLVLSGSINSSAYAFSAKQAASYKTSFMAGETLYDTHEGNDSMDETHTYSEIIPITYTVVGGGSPMFSLTSRIIVSASQSQ